MERMRMVEERMKGHRRLCSMRIRGRTSSARSRTQRSDVPDDVVGEMCFYLACGGGEDVCLSVRAAHCRVVDRSRLLSS